MRIGEWRVDPALGEITSGDRIKKLDPLTMRLLLYLADRAGQVVGLQELLDAVWPNVVVTPQSVYNTVAQLRRTLGDLADAPTYIANIPRMGYRLIATVERIAAGAEAPAQNRRASDALPPQPPRALRLPRATRRTVLIGGILTGLLFAAALARFAIQPPGTSRDLIAEHSIAVLPFRDLSEAKDQEFLAEGVAEEIGTQLSRVPKLRVIGRASAFASKADALPELVRKLHVDHVLEGTVQSSAHGLRITAELIRTDTGQYLWSKTYDRANADTFSVEDEIAGDVASALTNQVLAPRASAGACGQNGEANNLLLQGRYLGRRDERALREQSIDLYKKALDLEPDCARAWAWLSVAYGVQSANGWIARDVGFERARDAAKRALHLDPLEPDAHAALAYVEEYQDWNWSDAEVEVKRALALDPGDVRVLNVNGHVALDLGQTDRALALYRRAVDQDPLSPGALGGLGLSLWSRGQLVEAEAVFRQALAISPRRHHAFIALIILDRGDKTAALAEIEKETDPFWRLVGLGIIQQALGNREASDRALAELLEKFANRPYEIAEVYASRGDLDKAFEWLDLALTRHDLSLLMIKTNTAIKPLRGDARYAGLLQRMKLPP